MYVKPYTFTTLNMDLFWIIIVDKQVIGTSIKQIPSLKTSAHNISLETAEYLQKISRKFIDKTTYPNEVITEVDDPFVFKFIVDNYAKTQRVFVVGSYIQNFDLTQTPNTLNKYLFNMREKTETYRMYNDILTESQRKKFIEYINNEI